MGVRNKHFMNRPRLGRALGLCLRGEQEKKKKKKGKP